MLGKRQIKSILRESVRMTFDAIRQNKLRSTLTLLGISVGIFSVISVMTAIKTLESSIESGLNVFGTNTFLITKDPAIQFGRNEKYRNRKNIDLDQYLTLCVREWKKSEELAKHSCQPIHQCILLVYPTDYDKCEVLTEGDFERVKHP